MFSFIKEKWEVFFHSKSPRPITTSSSLLEIEKIYPHLERFLYERYKISLSKDKTRQMRLKDFVKKFALPPAQIFFMELQMQERVKNVKIISAKEAKELMDREKEMVLFDSRDRHEWDHHEKIAGAVFLEESNILESLKKLEENTVILCYCHFGVRSLNFASQIADLGFKNVHTIRGGIDEWSVEVDPLLPRYQGDYC